MTNLILTIIGIVLAALAALIAIDYGGDYFLVGYERAQATTIANAGDNVAAAYSVYTVQHRRIPANLSELTSSAQGRGLLKAIPEVNGLGKVSPTWLGINKPAKVASDPDVMLPAFVVEGLSPELCQRLNERINGFEEDSPIPVNAAFSKGCFNYEGSRVYVYYSYLSQQTSDTLTPYVPSVAPWPISAGGGASSGGSGGGGIGNVGDVDTAGWTLCATEGGRCEFTGQATVRYGFSGRFSYLVANDGVDCTDEVIGSDPLPSVTKACWFKPGRQPEVDFAFVNEIRAIGSQVTAAASRFWGVTGSAPQQVSDMVPDYLPSVPVIPTVASLQPWSLYSEGDSLALFQMPIASAEICAAINTSVNTGWSGRVITEGSERTVAEGCFLSSIRGHVYLKFYQKGAGPAPSPTPTPTPTPTEPAVIPGCGNGGAVNGGNTSASGYAAKYVPTQMCAGDFMDTPDGRFRLNFASGSLSLIYKPTFRVMWSTSTPTGREFVVQPDGNVFMQDDRGNSLWSTQTSGNPDARLILRDDGGLALYSSDRSRILWETRSEICTPKSVSDGVLSNIPNTYGRKGTLVPKRLCINEYVISPDGRFRLLMREDGNLVLGMGSGFQNIIWQSGTSDAYGLFSGDNGIIETRNRNGARNWYADQIQSAGTRLVLLEDGNMITFNESRNLTHWQSRTDYCLPKEQNAGDLPGEYGVMGRFFEQRLCNNEYVNSPNGKFRLTLRPDGNMAVTTGPDFSELVWLSNTPGGYYLVRTVGGVFQMKSRGAGDITYRSNTAENPGARMLIQDDGNLVIRNGPNDKLLWQSGSVYCFAQEKQSGTSASNYGVLGARVPRRLCQNEYVTSPNGRFRLVMGQDGILTLRTGSNFSTVIWRNSDAGSNAYALFMEDDGNFRTLSRDGSLNWATETSGNPGAFMMVQDDGNLTIHNQQGDQLLWQTRSNVCEPGERADGTGQDLFGTAGSLVPVRLCANEYVTSPNGLFRASISADGSVTVQTGPSFSQTIWSSGASSAYLLVTDADGTVRTVSREGVTSWNPGTGGNPGARMMMLNDGNLIIQNSSGSQLLWESRSDRCSPASKSAGVETSPSGASATRSPIKLCANEYVDSPNGRFRFKLEPDGRLSLYDGVGHTQLIWQSSYAADANIYRMLVWSTGELRTIRRDGSVAWSSNTSGNPNARLLVQNDGNVALYRDSVLLWETGTGGRDGPTPGSDAYKADVIRRSGQRAYEGTAPLIFIPTALEHVGMASFNYEGAGQFHSFVSAGERVMYEVKVDSAGVCEIIASQTGGTLADTGRETTASEGCASFATGYFYWKRVDDAQSQTQASYIRGLGAQAYSGSASRSGRPQSLSDVGMSSVQAYNLLDRFGFEQVGESWRFNMEVKSAAACRAVDALSGNGSRSISANSGYDLAAAEGCGGKGGRYYYWRAVEPSYDPALAAQLRAAGDQAQAAANSNGGPLVQSGRTAAGNALSSALQGKLFALENGIYEVESQYFAMVRVESASLCRAADRAAGNGDRGALLTYTPSTLPEGCGVYNGNQYWYWRALKSEGHRYWRILIHRSSDSVASASEIEFRGSPGGPDLTDGANGTAISSAVYFGFPASMAFDNQSTNGNYASAVSYSGNINHWIGYDFGAGNPVVVKEIMIKARTDGYLEQTIASGTVQWSDDNANWTNAFSFMNSPTTLLGQEFVSRETSPAPDAHRYWRIRAYDANDTYLRASEIEMRETSWGMNVARFGIPSSSSDYSGSYDKVYAFDGSAGSSHWAASTRTGWISVDLIIPRSINEVRIASAEGHKAPTDFAIEWSDDNVNWNEAWRTTNTNWASNQFRTFTRPNWTSPPAPEGPMATAVVLSGLNSAQCMQVAELELYSGGINRALASAGGIATSTPPYAAVASAANTNDGVRPAGYPNIFHSSCNHGDYLRIDLAQPLPVERLVVYGRTDYGADRDIFRYQIMHGSAVVRSGVIDARSGVGEVGLWE